MSLRYWKWDVSSTVCHVEEAKVEQLPDVVDDEDVVPVETSMDDAVLMEIRQRFQNISGKQQDVHPVPENVYR